MKNHVYKLQLSACGASVMGYRKGHVGQFVTSDPEMVEGIKDITGLEPLGKVYWHAFISEAGILMLDDKVNRTPDW